MQTRIAQAAVENRHLLGHTSPPTHNRIAISIGHLQLRRLDEPLVQAAAAPRCSFLASTGPLILLLFTAFNLRRTVCAASCTQCCSCRTQSCWQHTLAASESCPIPCDCYLQPRQQHMRPIADERRLSISASSRACATSCGGPGGRPAPLCRCSSKLKPLVSTGVPACDGC